MVLIYSVGKVHRSGWVGFRFQVVGLTALSNSLLAGDSYFGGMTTRFAEFLFFGMTIARMARKDCSRREGLVLALRASGIVIWNAKRLV